HDELEQNLLLNAVKAKVLNFGLAREPGEKQFTFFPEMSGMSGSLSNAHNDAKILKKMMMQHLQTTRDTQKLENDLQNLAERLFSKVKTCTCTLTTLSNMIQKETITKIDLLKIDVERAELDVLNGIQQKDWRKLKQIVLETHTLPLKNIIVELLERQGYDIFVETRKNDVLLENPNKYNYYTLAMIYAMQHTKNTRVRKTTIIEKNIPQLSIGAIENHLNSV
ncbi:MAG TPA: FkbM family methyltransferase, partial [Ktedonobacteraceae bacterium]|nr:FkbM family methyltransferase [Ktedonobacteraceae bacterium]